MAKTYITSPILPNLSYPKLHKIVYCSRNKYSPLTTEYQEISANIRRWCEQHCKEPYYVSPGWTDEIFVEFEDDEEAMMFALSIPFNR